LEKEEERREDQRLRIMGGVGPGTDRTDGTSGNCTIEDSDIGEPELGECNGVDTDERASGERDGGERDGGERDGIEIRWRGIKVLVLYSGGTAKFQHESA